MQVFKVDATLQRDISQLIKFVQKCSLYGCKAYEIVYTTKENSLQKYRDLEDARFGVPGRENLGSDA